MVIGKYHSVWISLVINLFPALFQKDFEVVEVSGDHITIIF